MEFVTTDPSATVRGANVRATLAALEKVPTFSSHLIERYGFVEAELTGDKFIPVQRWLDALREIQEHIGEPALRQTGIRVVEKADFPAEYPSVEAILLALNTIYYLNHAGDVGHYQTQQRVDGIVVVHCETPYPRNFERGLVEGICRNKRAGGTLYCVEYEDGPARSARTCTLTVHRA